MITQERLKEVLNYNPDTGVFTWKVSLSNRIKVGDKAGHLKSDGYRTLQVDGKVVFCHRLAWMYIYGTFPEQFIDHINGVRDDNRIANLREASRSQNNSNRKIGKNNKSGYKGVYFYKPLGKWLASIRVNNKSTHLGYYPTAEEANIVVMSYRERIHGEFTNHG